MKLYKLVMMNNYPFVNYCIDDQVKFTAAARKVFRIRSLSISGGSLSSVDPGNSIDPSDTIECLFFSSFGWSLDLLLSRL